MAIVARRDILNGAAVGVGALAAAIIPAHAKAQSGTAQTGATQLDSTTGAENFIAAAKKA